MNTFSFVTLLFLPSLGIVYIVLASYFGLARAYVALAWVPLALVGVLWTFDRLAFLAVPVWRLDPLATALEWTSLVQALFGVALAVTAVARREPWSLLAVAAALAAVPYLADVA